LTPTFSATGMHVGTQACCSTSPGSKPVAAPEPRGSRSISPGRKSGILQRIASTSALGRGADVASTATVQHRRASGGPWRSSVVRTMSSGAGGFDRGGGSGACKSADRGHGPPPKVVQSARPLLTAPQGTSQGRQAPCGTYSSSIIAMPPPSAQQQQQQQQQQPQTQSRIMRASSTPLQTIRGCKGSGGQVATLAPNSSFSRRT